MSDKDHWERHARNYDVSLHRVLGRPLPRMLQLASEAVRGKDKVLEVAAGTGIVTSAIARASHSVIATDYVRRPWSNCWRAELVKPGLRM